MSLTKVPDRQSLVMPIGPVDWGAHSHAGETLEQVMAVLLFQERPTAWRREPARGDAGVDVAHPVTGGYHIFQVKRFSKQPTAKQKMQIAKSYERLLDDPSLDRPVVRWSLVLPVDWTKHSEKWFRTLTHDAAFESEWLGEVFWNSQAAKYPYVIDYFFENGKERLTERVRTLAELLRDPGAKVLPANIGTTLGNLSRELGDTDPYYRYDFRVTNSPPELSNRPNVATSATRQVGPSTWVTFDIVPKWPGALLERPITVGLTYTLLDTDRGIDLRDEYQAHIDYGTPFKIPAEAVAEFRLDLPGGLADGVRGAVEVQVGARRPLRSEPLWIDVDLREADGNLAAQALLAVREQSTGQKGLRLLAADSTGLIRIEALMAPPENLKGRVNFTLEMICPAAGRPIAVVGGPLRFLANYRVGRSAGMSIRRHFGSFASGRGPVEQDAMPAWQLTIAYLDILEELQRSTSVPLLIAESIDQEYWEQLVRAQTLLRGERIDATWHNVTLVLEKGWVDSTVSAIREQQGIWHSGPLVLPNGDSQVILGVARQTITDAQVYAVEELGSGDTRVTLRPGPHARAWEALESKTSQDPALDH